LGDLEIDWTRTAAWGDGGYYGRIFLNVAGREPGGIVPPSEYDTLRDELIRKLEALGDERGHPIGTRVYKPEEIYTQTRRIAPDLIALFGDLHWRSVGSVGWNTVWVDENDTGPDDANHARHGLFVAANVKGLQGELKGLKLTQVAGTTLQLLGLPSPADLESRPIGS
jgi:predicted AlkP superfamily phosphohydrolase/phosphomutase